MGAQPIGYAPGREDIDRLQFLRRQSRKAEDRISVLTPREREVLSLLAKGQPNKGVAHKLQISPRTVEIHRANAMRKLEVRSIAEMLRLAFLAELF